MYLLTENNSGIWFQKIFLTDVMTLKSDFMDTAVHEADTVYLTTNSDSLEHRGCLVMFERDTLQGHPALFPIVDIRN